MNELYHSYDASHKEKYMTAEPRLRLILDPTIMRVASRILCKHINRVKKKWEKVLPLSYMQNAKKVFCSWEEGRRGL